MLLSGVGQGNGPNANTINTTESDIGVGNQSIEGHEVHGGNDQPAEILRLDFVNNLTFSTNPFAYNGHYEDDVASFGHHPPDPGQSEQYGRRYSSRSSMPTTTPISTTTTPLPITLNNIT